MTPKKEKSMLTINSTDSVSQSRSPTVNTESHPTGSVPAVSRFAANSTCTCNAGKSNADLLSSPSMENVASHSGNTIHRILELPTSDSTGVIDNDSLRLPDINPYLPKNTDTKTAAALAALYRSHCISVIDSFRYCKERNLMKYFSAFHGTLTVPVQRLLSQPSVAPWVKECDWLMYQKMIAFVAPLTTQVVPQLVLDTFSSISRRLTGHILETSRNQPSHVTLARLEAAHIFCKLLRHMLDVNQAANAAAAWLCRVDNRNRMWFDFKTLVDPQEVMFRANIPSCAAHATEQLLKHDIRALLTPLEDPKPSVAQPFFNQPDSQGDVMAHKWQVESSPIGEEYNFPDKWISIILQLPLVFPDHPTKCIIDKTNTLWDCVLHRLTLGGAQSFSAWWMTKVFFHEMMLWQAEKTGFMNTNPGVLHRRAEEEKAMNSPEKATTANNSLENNSSSADQAAASTTATAAPNDSFMRVDGLPDAPGAGNDRQTTTESSTDNNGINISIPQSQPISDDKKDQRAPAANDSKPPPPAADLPENIASLNSLNNDDSAIDLDDDSMLMSVGKYGDMMASDPADAEGDVIVI